jgi:hypothetical protein
MSAPEGQFACFLDVEDTVFHCGSRLMLPIMGSSHSTRTREAL